MYGGGVCARKAGGAARNIASSLPNPASMTVEHWNPETDGNLTEAALRRKLEARGYAVTRYVYAPGTTFPDRAHDVDKCDAVVAGRFRLTSGGGGRGAATRLYAAF